MKKMIIPCFIVVEWILFLIYCTVSSGGFAESRQLHAATTHVLKEINNLQVRKKTLEQEKKDWESYDFYKEQEAREQLHLYCPGETIIIFDQESKD